MKPPCMEYFVQAGVKSTEAGLQSAILTSIFVSSYMWTIVDMLWKN